MKIILVFFSLLLAAVSLRAQDIPTHSIIAVEELSQYLKEDLKKEMAVDGEIREASLAAYFRQKFSERFFYDWRTVDARFEQYEKIYAKKLSHYTRAEDHMQKYADSTQWVLPFNYLNGDPVNAYGLRHLARQHKMIDISFLYFYEQKDPKYIQYFVNQRNSLNTALELGAYEKIKDGNGTYENFRSSYRALNWLEIHNRFLGENDYSDKDQLKTIATLLQQGAHLYSINESFTPGNHQTRGVSGLAMLSILLRDFVGTDQWYARAMERLGEHLSNEVNDDGFQSERSVHYHMSDIGNYYYVYQLAKISGIKVSEVWEDKLHTLFSTLVKIAYPDKSAPVLQDDTDNPWAEKNDISGAVTLGYLLFEDPEFGYFADRGVEGKMYWFLNKKQLDLLENIESIKPSYGSLVFPETDYYIMREGWDKNDKMMIISAGLDEEKPSHQHGDMLGIQAVANGQNILPNYQVRYSLPDFDMFKNSMVKNVALVDDELIGKKWTPNAGKTGYGQYADLPDPTTITWKSNEEFDLFVGSHDGFENVGVSYTRQVIYIKDDFWLVKDNFKSDAQHTYKQVWQGHYTTEEGPELLRAVFNDASGCDILQLGAVNKVESDGSRGKQWTVVSQDGQKNHQFTTIIFPYKGYDKRVDEAGETTILKGWKVNNPFCEVAGADIQSLSTDQEIFLFNVKKITIGGIEITFSNEADVFVKNDKDEVTVHSIGDAVFSVVISGSKSNVLNGKDIGEKTELNPGDFVAVLKE